MVSEKSNANVEKRVEDLLSKMTMAEKINQLCCLQLTDDGSKDFANIHDEGIGNISAFFLPKMADESVNEVAELAKRIRKVQEHIVRKTRLGIPALFHCEAVNGAVFAEATAFPSAIGQASTWDPSLVNEMAGQIRLQVRAVGYQQVLSPVFDISRDPRWGRLTETYGEDETLAAAMAVAYVSGLQGDVQKPGLVATGKHFVGHGVTECGLNAGQNPITERELREVHCKPFQAAISKANLLSVMNSYCSINREPIVSSRRILTGLLREELGFSGIFRYQITWRLIGS